MGKTPATGKASAATNAHRQARHRQKKQQDEVAAVKEHCKSLRASNTALQVSFTGPLTVLL